ncbi:hypothetical protein GTP55_13205 [Duganella sp. FT109W]|uniref:Ricin B lectin domain-containing protein n=1 Tax=Duganella margarita TaxID=2692170 RepID=A0ABW9WGY7_9BURK|nr:hypothetical protein [Duganella margarita]MYN40333.1 hypothetical protein [Duganella margarita]
MMYFKISSQLESNGSALFLTAISESATVTAAPNNSGDSQLWTPIAWISPTYKGGFLLINKATDTAICAPSFNGPVTLGATANAAIWNWAFPTEDPDVPSGYAALQLTNMPNQDNQNLNILNDDPETLGVWVWGGGLSNEIWQAELSPITD